MKALSILMAPLVVACASSSQAVRAPTSATTSTVSTTTVSPSGTTTSTTTVTTGAAVAMNPVGSYSFETEFNGDPVTGTINIRNIDGKLGGNVVATGLGEFPITNVKVEGQALIFTFDTPNGTSTSRLAFAGDVFAGTWELGGQTGSMKGKRLP
jgi:hypothetical protein